MHFMAVLEKLSAIWHSLTLWSSRFNVLCLIVVYNFLTSSLLLCNKLLPKFRLNAPVWWEHSVKMLVLVFHFKLVPVNLLFVWFVCVWSPHLLTGITLCCCFLIVTVSTDLSSSPLSTSSVLPTPHTGEMMSSYCTYR